MNNPNYIFAKGDLTNVLEDSRRKLHHEIAVLPPGQVGPGVIAQIESALLEKYHIEPLELFWDREDHVKEEVTVQRTSDFGRMISRQEVVIRIRVPFTGEKDLFGICPTGIAMNAPRARVHPDVLEFTYQAAGHDLASIRRDYDEDVRMTKQSVTRTNELVAAFNNELPNIIRRALEARREKVQAEDKALTELGFNFRRREDPPASSAFPVTRKTVAPTKPAAPFPALHKPDPHLEIAQYEDILRFLTGMSVAIERSPSTFGTIDEQPLRDWFVVALNGSFQGDATGETFNREGKTDISIRVNGGVIFVAECKFWSGEKGLLEAIDQLLGYLTWRDSKAAILLFSRNADFSAVLRQIPAVIIRHPNFVRHVNYPTETGVRFMLRNKTDQEREHLVTLLAFNVPRVGR